MSKDHKHIATRLAGALRTLRDALKPQIEAAAASGNILVEQTAAALTSTLDDYEGFEQQVDGTGPRAPLSPIEEAARRENYGRQLATTGRAFSKAAGPWIADSVSGHESGQEAIRDAAKRANALLYVHGARENSRSAMARKLEDILAISRGHMLNGNRLAIEIESALAEHASAQSPSEQSTAAQRAPDEWIRIQDAWVAAGGNPGIKASKEDLLVALRMLDELTDDVDEITRDVGDVKPRTAPQQDGPAALTGADLAEASALGAQNAVEQFLKGTHEVFDDINGENGLDLDSSESQCLIARMVYYSERGDDSVGMQGINMWALGPDQSGTHLEKLVTANKAMAEAFVALHEWVEKHSGPGDRWASVLVRQMLETHAKGAVESARGRAAEQPPARPRLAGGG